MKLVAENFLSWEYLEFDLSKGVTLIDGYNYDDNTSEGSGKSSVINSLCWAMFGKLPKDVKIDDVIKQGQKGTCVTLQIDDYEIKRSRGPNTLLFTKAGKNVGGRTATDTQKKIEETLGISFKLFTQSIYFAQNNYSKFITATEEDKAKILSEIQDLTIFDAARKETHENYKDLYVSIKELKHKQDLFKEKQSSIDSYITELKTNRVKYEDQLKDFEEKTKLRIFNLEKKVKEVSALEIDIDSLQKEIEATNLVNMKNKEKQRDLKLITFELGLLEKQIKTKEEHLVLIKDNKCPTCDQSIVNSSLYEKEEESLKKLQLNKEELISKQKETVLEEVEDLTDKIQKLEDLKKEHSAGSANKYLIDELRLNLLNNQLESTISDLVKSIDSKGEELKQILKQIEINDQTLNLKQTELAKYEVLKASFKEVKTYLFETLLRELTVKTNYYVSELFNIPVQVNYRSFTEEDKVNKIETRIIMDGEDRAIGLLSGGQLKRVEIATNLALNEIICNRTMFSLRIFDEPFSGLSESSMSKCIKLFEKQKGVTILIEHNSIIKNIVDRVFEIEYKNGTSKLKENYNFARSIN